LRRRTIDTGKGRFVVGVYNSSIAAWSDDCRTWNEISLPLSFEWRSMVCGRRRFVMLGIGNKGLWSDNGIEWNEMALPVSGKWDALIYGKNRFVALSQNSYSGIVSDNGIDWTSFTTPSTGCTAIAFGKGQFVANLQNSAKAAKSANGTDWETVDLFEAADWQGLVYGNGRFVMTAYNTAMAAWSDDGAAWTKATLPQTGLWSKTAGYAGGQFFLLEEGSNKIARSRNGADWTVESNSALGNYKTRVLQGKNKTATVKTTGNICAYSEDSGTTWKTASMPRSAYWLPAAYGVIGRNADAESGV
jgi:hypothetical protein